MRSQKIDSIRGFAILGMILFHAHYMLIHIFGYTSLDTYRLSWYIFWRIVAITFIIIAGVSYRLQVAHKPRSTLIKTSIKRALLLSGIAFLISIVTFVWFHEQRIVFGIIHFFALSTLIAPFFLRFWSWNIALGMGIFFLQTLLENISATNILLIPFWIIHGDFYSADYYPLIPWFWYFLIGYGIMNLLEGNVTFLAWLQKKWKWMAWVAWIGKRSLWAYVIHVPLLYIIFTLFL